jgi:hypothetical protein
MHFIAAATVFTFKADVIALPSACGSVKHCKPVLFQERQISMVGIQCSVDTSRMWRVV